MTGVWSWRSNHRGGWWLLRDGHEVGSLDFTVPVPYPIAVLQAVCEQLDKGDRIAERISQP